MIVIEKIAEFLGYVTDYLKIDYILYGASGLIVLVFILAMLPIGYAARFRKRAKAVSAYLKSGAGTEELDKKMEALPKQASLAWKDFKAAENAEPALYLTQNACLDVRAKRGAAQKYLFLVVFTAFTAFLLNLLTLKNGAVLGAKEAVTPLAVMILGVIFALIIEVVKRAGYRKALAAYNELIACLNAHLPEKERGPVFALPEGATVHPETFREPAEVPAVQPFSPPAKAYWEQNDAFTPPPPAAQTLVYADPQKEDVVAQIERITASNASKQTMLDVAKLLQAERAKAENKTPEQQRRLNAALATLLRAISTAQ